MGDHALYASIIAVGCGFGAGQHQCRIKNIQAFVFHRTHVEIINGHDVKKVQIIFAAVIFFVPFHGADQRIHGVITFCFIPGADIDIQVYGPARLCCKIAVDRHQFTRNQRK